MTNKQIYYCGILLSRMSSQRLFVDSQSSNLCVLHDILINKLLVNSATQYNCEGSEREFRLYLKGDQGSNNSYSNSGWIQIQCLQQQWLQKTREGGVKGRKQKQVVSGLDSSSLWLLLFQRPLNASSSSRTAFLSLTFV